MPPWSNQIANRVLMATVNRERNIEMAKVDSQIWSLAVLLGIPKEQMATKTAALTKYRNRVFDYLYHNIYENSSVRAEAASVDDTAILEKISKLSDSKG